MSNIEENPVYWFTEFWKSVESGNTVAADAAQQRLRDLGYDVKRLKAVA